MNLFYILKDASGKFLPMAFISPIGPAGNMRAEEYKNKKLEEGEEIATVMIIEVEK